MENRIMDTDIAIIISFIIITAMVVLWDEI